MLSEQKRDRGFSLVECLVVLVLIAIIGGLAVPWLRSNPVRSLNAAARMLQGNFQQARLLAQRDNRPYYVDFSRDLDGDGNLDAVLWRDLGNPPLNGTLDLADADGNGVPDEIVGAEALFLGTANTPPYGRNLARIALGPGASGPASGPPNFPGLWSARFQDPITGVMLDGGLRFVANPDGTCTSGSAFLAEAADPLSPQPTRATYCVAVSPAGSVQVWRWNSTNPVWERL